MALTFDRRSVQWAGLFAGPLLAVAVYLLLPEHYVDGRGETALLGQAGRSTAAIGTWMAVWWMTEAIPIYATALLPLALLPLTGAATIKQAATPYGHELIFLFMGGFIIALALQRWGLHERIALGALRLVGTQPRRIVGAFMAITALLSMWVSNTATTIMLLPLASSVIGLFAGPTSSSDGANGQGPGPSGEARNFSLCLLLGIAYAASIGGIGTPIGTPPNGVLLAYVNEQLGADLSFVRWMAVGLPVVAVFIPVAWLMLTRVSYPIRAARIEGAAAIARRASDALGPVKPGEWATAVVFALAACSWIFRRPLTGIEWGGWQPFEGLTDAGIAIAAALLLFVIPIEPRRRVFVMDWETAVKLPWGVLVLFGGGLSLAAAIRANGVGEYLGSQVGVLAGVPPLLLVLGVVTLVIFLTELTSNTATTVTFVPILAELATGLGLDPYLLIVPATLAASCAFMLPVATPPNAVVFGSGRVTIPQMCKAGLWLNLVGIGVVTALTYAVALPLLGVSPPG